MKLQNIAIFLLVAITLILLIGPVVVGETSPDYIVEKGISILLGAGKYAWLALGWIVVGVVLGGMAMEFIPQNWFAQELGGTGPKTILKATFMGSLIDVCSHGALAVGISLYKSGASVASTVTFLLATPWLGFMETLLLLGLLGWKITISVIVASLIAAFTIGNIIGFLERRGWIESHKTKIIIKKVRIRTDAKKRFSAFDWSTLPSRIMAGIKKGISLFEMIAIWLVIGFLATGLVITFIKSEQIASLMGYASVSALPFTAFMATLIEVCSEGTVPLVAAFSDMGASIGAVFVFLMAGVASDLTELGVIADVIGKRAAIATFIVAITVSIILGYMLNWFWLAFIL